MLGTIILIIISVVVIVYILGAIAVKFYLKKECGWLWLFSWSLFILPKI